MTQAVFFSRGTTYRVSHPADCGDRGTIFVVSPRVLTDHASPYHFARVFQERAGVPVHRYLTRLRLRAALDRLAQGDEDLVVIARAVGYSSHSHLTASFRRVFGIPPSRARRRLT